MTHYEVLGVAPEAGLDEIRAAYRARARELHPDRFGSPGDPGGDTPGIAGGEVGGGGAAMAAVNLAWAVLGDPARRAAYDRSLRPGAAGSGPATPGPSVTVRYDAEHPPPVHAALPGCLGSGALPWMVVVAVLIVIFVFTAYAGSGGDQPDTPSGGQTEGSLVAVRDVRGMCIRVAGGITSAVDCLTVPHQGRIVAQAAVGGSCPAGTDEWLLRHLDTLACTEASTAVGP